MKISSLTLIVTSDCNFSCQYCYQKHSKIYMDYSTARKALNFFHSFLSKSYNLNFYGGEPLLSFPLIKKIVSFLEGQNHASDKKSTYSITTNASLLTDERYQLFNEYKFSIEISFDGLAQDFQRQGKSAHSIVDNIKKMQNYPDIEFEVNSVFTPRTVSILSKSIGYLIELGIPNIRFSFDTITQWNEEDLEKLKAEIANLKITVRNLFRESESIPVINFREKLQKGQFACNAGKERLAVSPDGEIWGCFLFPDYFKGKENSPDYFKYSFGKLDHFIKDHEKIYPEISSNYSNLSMNNFSTSQMDCLFCSYLQYCRVCPINAAFSGEAIGRIPTHLCLLKRALIDEINNLSE